MKADLDWLFEKESPGARYLALRDLLGLEANDPELIRARAAAHDEGPIHTILEAMLPEGYWQRPGTGYNPKYYSAVWSLISLAQLGAVAAQDERIGRACAYLMEHGMTGNGQFTATGAPSGTIDCLQGNMCAAMIMLGYEDLRLESAFEWMARTVTGEGIAPNSEKEAPRRYYAYKCGPMFACGVNNSLPCAWGAAKVMLALSLLPVKKRTPQIEKAIKTGVDFLLGVDPASADYPCGNAPKPSPNWWKFGFPVFYVTDILQIAEALVNLGYGSDPRLENALKFIEQKRNTDGRWVLEYSYKDKTWVNYGEKSEPNKWVTLRAMKVLRKAGLLDITAAV